MLNQSIHTCETTQCPGPFLSHREPVLNLEKWDFSALLFLYCSKYWDAVKTSYFDSLVGMLEVVSV